VQESHPQHVIAFSEPTSIGYIKDIDAATQEALRERNVANTLIDGLGLHVVSEQTADHAYL
jgi:hypothetical protein